MQRIYSEAQLDTENDQVSYRQKGCEVKGSLYRGPICSAFSKKQLGSIPAKLETILDPIAFRPSKGSGSKTYRFTNNFDNENPGPGKYESLSTLSIGSGIKSVNPGSYSKKGLGNGFISTNERFKILNHFIFQKPGPGIYNEGDKRISERFKLKSNRVFEKQKGKEKVISETVGPGEYKVEKSEERPRKKTNSFFLSMTDRFKSKHKRFPSVGQYNINSVEEKRKMATGKISHYFKAPLALKRVKVNLYEPFAPLDPNEGQIPGPGTYSKDHNTIIQGFNEKAKIIKKSTAFVEPLLTDKFGVPKFRKNFSAIPGPGKYEPSLECCKEAQVNKDTAQFKNSVKRLPDPPDLLKKIPGPAFYKTRHDFLIDQKNANPANLWL